MKKICVSLLVLLLSVGNVSAETRDEYIQAAQALSKAFSSVAEDVTPSVVNINSFSVIKRRSPRLRFAPNGRSDFFLDFYGDEAFRHFFQEDALPQEGLKQQNGMGSGFIVDEEGHILTNNHVIEDADEIKVRLYNNKTYKASVVGVDDSTDLAVLKIEADEKLTPLKLGDSEKLKVGEWVVAVGNPFGLDHTITTGVVSAKGRSISPESMKYEDYIQTDAAINPGNSGGPLVDLYGNAVGINSVIFSRNGGYMGVGFAIPINLAKNVLNSILKHGRVVRGQLGVMIQDLTPELRESFNFNGDGGSLVGDVTPNGPAERAGIRIGDIIVNYNGKAVNDTSHVRFMVAETAPNTTVPVTVIRSGVSKTFDVTMGEKKDGPELLPQQQEIKTQLDDTGLSLRDITPQLKAEYGLKTLGSVFVERVSPYSAASKAGIQAGDVILKCDDTDLTSSEQFKQILKNRDPNKRLRLVVETDGMKHFVVM